MAPRREDPDALPAKPTPELLALMPRPVLSIPTALTLGRAANLFPRWMALRIESRHGIVSNRLVLMWLLANSGELRMGAVAHMLDLTPRAVTGQVDALENDGYVERRTSQTDGRVIYVKLTRKGSKLIADLAPELIEAFTSLFACLEEAEMREMIRILEKLTDHIKDELDNP